MSTDWYARLEERQVVVLDRACVSLMNMLSSFCVAAALQMVSVSQGVEFRSRRMRRSRSPIMSTSSIAFSEAKRAALLRYLHVVPAAVGVIGGLPLADGFLAVQKQQLDGERILAILEHPRQFQQECRARAAIVRTDEAELAEALGVEVAGDDEAVGACARNGGDEVHHVDASGRRGVVPRLFGDVHLQLGELGLDVLAGLVDGR